MAIEPTSPRRSHAFSKASFIAIAPSIVATSAFAYDDFDAGMQRFSGEQPGFLYSRFANPTVLTFEAKMAALEGGEAAGFA
ncbi:PLP-dependent transferase [Cupriavidus basilensis]|uniref:PLP-dependent transferase n=1 Tax=Cupriavidus basilensis TaxID=68895 RepID=UPI00157A7117|nr:PLP-dependent transferase [Cupriavidus basilensis]NUA27645.1 hypothetical protein [Cupriavidus basilensis]